jgi:DNA-binding transcriptional regulator YiaG
MARPIDPTSRNQIEQRAKRLRSEESGWTRSLCLGIAMAALKAWQWAHYLESRGELGPLAGPFPKLPEEPGSWVLVGAHPATQTARHADGVVWGNPDPGKAFFFQDVKQAEAPSDRAIWGFGPVGLPDMKQSRVHLLRGGQWLEDGQADGCEVPDLEQLARAMELAGLLQEKHLLNHLRPGFYQEVALWIGELLKQPRPETYSPPEETRAAIWVDPKNWNVMGTETPMEGQSVLMGSPGFPWPGDLWRVPGDPLGIPSEEDLYRYGIAAEDIGMSAAAWHFGRVLYRKVLDPRAINGQSGLERPALLRQLLEELEVVAPRGLATRSVAEKPVASMATHEVAALGLRAFPREDLWDETEDGRGRYLHKRRGRQWELTMATGSGEELAFKSLAQCRRILKYKNAGVEITALHALLCCYLMQLKDPSSRFTVSGKQLLRDLGYETRRTSREGSTRSDLLKELGKWATLLGLAQCEGWSRPEGGERFSMELGPMWSISIHADGQLQLLDQEDYRPDTLTDLVLTVTPGTWTETQRWVTRDGSHLLYSPIATEILQLGRHRRELAFRLGIHLALGFRERRQWSGGVANERVGQLLEEVLPQGELERARRNRDEGMKLRDKWNAAVATLRDAVGFSFAFPNCLPELIPPDFAGHEAGTAPSGALELLLNSRVEIHWPEKVVEARHRKPLAEIQEQQARRLIRQQQARLLNQRPTDNAAKLKAAREASGMTQRAAAPLLGISQAQISKLENGKDALPEAELNSYVALLETVRRRPRK